MVIILLRSVLRVTDLLPDRRVATPVIPAIIARAITIITDRIIIIDQIITDRATMAAVISRVITISLIAPVTTVAIIVLTARATMAETTSRVTTTALTVPVITEAIVPVTIIAPAMTGISVARTAVTDTSLRRAPVILTGRR